MTCFIFYCIFYYGENILNHSKSDKKTTSLYKNIKKCIDNGRSDTLSDTELLTALLAPSHPHMNITPMVTALISKFKNLSTIMAVKDNELASTKWITRTAISTILFTAQVYKETLRRSKGHKQTYRINKTSDAVIWFRENIKDSIGLHVLYMNGQNNILDYHIIDQDDGNTANLGIDIIKYALTQNALGIIVLHYIDSPDTVPKKTDIMLAQIIRDTGKDLEIKLMEYIMLNQINYSSVQILL